MGKAAGLIFRENQFAVFLDVENTFAAFAQNDFNFGKLLLDFLLQTGGLGAVVSHHAVLNLDFHPSPFADGPGTRRN